MLAPPMARMPLVVPTTRTRRPLISAVSPIVTPSLPRSISSTTTAPTSRKARRIAGLKSRGRLSELSVTSKPVTVTSTLPPVGPRQSPPVKASVCTVATSGWARRRISMRAGMARARSKDWVRPSTTQRSARALSTTWVEVANMPISRPSWTITSRPAKATASTAAR